MIRQGLLWATIVGFCAWVSAQQTAQLDFFADAGGFETDYNNDGREDFVSDFVEGGVQWEHITRNLDFQTKYAGTASQRIELQRSTGGAGRYVIFKRVNFDAPLRPEIGEPLLVRVAIRAQGFQNATYQVHVTTGNRRVVILPHNAQPRDWQLLSAVVPVELNASGQPNFALHIELIVGEGAAQGTLWIDEAQALSTRTLIRNNTLPNGLKLALTYLYRQRNSYEYLNEFPINVVVGPVNIATTLTRHYPSTIFAPYTQFPGPPIDPGTRHSADLYHYEDVEQNHPDWFLLTTTGERILADGRTYYLDVGLPAVRERAWQNLRNFMNRSGRPRYVMQDNVDVVVARRYTLQRYPNNDLWVQAVIGWYEYVGSRLKREFGSTFIPNVAWAPGFYLRGIAGYPDAPGVTILPYIGGFFVEHAFMRARAEGGHSIPVYGTATGTNSPAQWDRRVMRDTIRLVTEYPDKIAILIPTIWLGEPDTAQRLRFVIAGCLMVQHENTYIQIDPRRQQDQHPSGFYPPELFVPLGRWTENYRILNGDLISGGLFVRNYENGIVVWNPTHDRDFTFTVPRDLYDWDRNLIRAGTVVQIPRQTGHVFYSAPEITLELSPQNTQVLPGQTTQFTVTYRNRGTAPGTNVRIAVPLPQGMTLVGSNPTARLENGQVVWVIPSVPVGGQGTLRFTVRVE